MRTVTVFGSSAPKPGEPEYEAAVGLGAALGAAGVGTCTGGYGGVMEAVSKGAREAGAEATGVTIVGGWGEANRYLTRVLERGTLFARIETLIGEGDAYVALPGGTGTLLELTAVWEYVNKGFLDPKPIVAVGDMWKPALDALDARLAAEGRRTGRVTRADSAEEAARILLAELGGYGSSM
ncbi:MAG: LOG family protein [Ignavibacteriales bacterium]|nr:LOG family protein [Ignavibacteriales bacterium]